MNVFTIFLSKEVVRMKTLVKRYSGEVSPEEKKQFSTEIGKVAFYSKSAQEGRYLDMKHVKHGLNSSKDKKNNFR